MAENYAPKVSVLVPIYNVEKYLRQCLDSIVNQTLEDIEIICLNDGSTDGSPEIIKEFAKNDPRIVVVDKPNSGYGDSMNKGLEKARGEYIGIVESDDWIDSEAFEELYTLAKTNGDADIVRANYYHNKGGVDKKFFYVEPSATGKAVNPHHQTWIFLQAPAIWSAIYRREFLNENHIRFLPTPGASYQDTGFNFKAWACAKKVCFTTQAFLHYRTDNEASSVKSDGKIMNVYMEYAEIEKFLKERDLLEELGPVMATAKFGAYYWNMLRVSPKFLTEFLEKAKIEYTDAQDKGFLFEEYFGNPEKWKLVNAMIAESPRSIKNRLRFIKLKHKMRNIAKQTFKVLRPSYTKQQEMSDLIDELYAQYDALEQQIKFLESNTIETSKEPANE